MLGHDRDLGDWYVAPGGSKGCYGLVDLPKFVASSATAEWCSRTA